MLGAVLAAVVVTAITFTQHGSVVDEAPPLVRVKPVDTEMRRLVTDGYQRSATFRALIAEIHQTNVIVAIQFGLCANGRVRSCVTNVDGDERQRHVRIKVNTRTTDDRLIATVAHELQHALEIAREPQVWNAQQALALYRRIGIGKCREGLSERCETQAALEIERSVNDELAQAKSLR